jgi:hypothetical protein
MQGLHKDMKLLEIGGSHNPTIPKHDGWNTTVVDYTDAEELRSKYEVEEAHPAVPG